MASTIWLSRQKRTAQSGTITITGYDGATTYRIHVPDVNGPFAKGSGGGTPTTVATALAANWASLAGGEFSTVTADAALAIVTLTAKTAGDPFTAFAAASGGAGTIGAYTPVDANTSPNDVNDAVNWSLNALPVNTNDAFIDAGDADQSLKWNLGALSAVTLNSINFLGQFTGDCGLPRKNEAGGHDEYLAEYFAISATTVNVNTYGGTGSGMILLDTGANATTVNVYSTGTGRLTDLAAFIWKGTHVANVMRIESGSVDVAPYGGEVATIATLTINAGSCRCSSGVTLTTIVQNGGDLDTSSAIVTINQYGGSHVHRSGNLTTPTLLPNGGSLTLLNQEPLTITTLVLNSGTTLDVSGAVGAVTITNATFHGGCTINDPNKLITHTNPWSAPDGINSVNYIRGGTNSVQFS